MISLFCKHFRDSYFSRIEAAPNNHIRRQQEHQLDKLLRDLHRDDNENESFIKPEAAVRTPVELEFNCTKNEGIKYQMIKLLFLEFELYFIPRRGHLSGLEWRNN